jgi:hypothetical protein
LKGIRRLSFSSKASRSALLKLEARFFFQPR